MHKQWIAAEETIEQTRKGKTVPLPRETLLCFIFPKHGQNVHVKILWLKLNSPIILKGIILVRKTEESCGVSLVAKLILTKTLIVSQLRDMNTLPDSLTMIPKHTQ